jgi:Bifunctional DNA primase/polymerase, N-terminal
MADFKKAALFYASLGWKVLPLAPGSKATLIPVDPQRARAMGFSGPGKGVHDATDDADLIETWASICPNANLGIAMGKPSRSIFGFDIDTRITGAEGELKELIRKHGAPPRAPIVRTRSGGWHMYLDGSDAPADFKKKLMKRVPCEGGKCKSVATGLEIKWTGGYLVAPPSYIAE